MEPRYDVAVVGAGIVGLATSLALLELNPRLRIAVVEKEAAVACHQTGHNSGVIHSGIYYRPGTLRARLCVQGVQQMLAFCDSHGVRYERCGKVIVATSRREEELLEELYRRGTANGVPGLRKIGRQELREIEPHATGLAALHSPNTAIVDFKAVAEAMAQDIRARGAELLTGRQVERVARGGSRVTLHTPLGDLSTRVVANCAGLYADTVARGAGVIPTVRIVPFRGEYYLLRPERRDLVRGLIYPVSDPQLPFLGVHFTRTVHGEVEAGPNAVLAFAREGYTPRSVRAGELLRTVTYPGFVRLARRFWRTGLYEIYRSVSTAAFVTSLQKLVPEVTSDDVVRDGSGVRAQAVTPAGALSDDFIIQESPNAIHVLNAPSPAATASLAIGSYIARRVMASLSQAQR